MRLVRFNPTAEHVPGKSLVADTLSRSALPIDVAHMAELHSEIDASIDMILSNRASLIKLMQIRIATWDDPILQRVLYYTKHGWPKYTRSLSKLSIQSVETYPR